MELIDLPRLVQGLALKVSGIAVFDLDEVPTLHQVVKPPVGEPVQQRGRTVPPLAIMQPLNLHRACKQLAVGDITALVGHASARWHIVKNR